jgi:predicted DNA-binding protein
MLNEKKPKLRISPKKYNGDTSVISTRIPKEMLKDIDTVAGTTGRTRNEIMLMCLEYALNNMEIIND